MERIKVTPLLLESGFEGISEDIYLEISSKFFGLTVGTQIQESLGYRFNKVTEKAVDDGETELG